MGLSFDTWIVTLWNVLGEVCYSMRDVLIIIRPMKLVLAWSVGLVCVCGAVMGGGEG